MMSTSLRGSDDGGDFAATGLVVGLMDDVEVVVEVEATTASIVETFVAGGDGAMSTDFSLGGCCFLGAIFVCLF